jgi:aspartate racemase
VIGVLGGMGPAAGADFLARLVAATSAQRDQDHLHVVLDSDPSVPDRTDALVSGGPSPVPTLRRMARRLAGAGADILVMACNTASAVLPELAGVVPVTFLRWNDVVAAELSRTAPRGARCRQSAYLEVGDFPRSTEDFQPRTADEKSRNGPDRLLDPRGLAAVLATDGTQASRLYDDALARHGIEVFPTTDVQPEVMAIIRARKAGAPVAELAPRLDRVVGNLIERDAGQVLLACTELSELSAALTTSPVDAVDLVIAHLLRRVGQWRSTGHFIDDGLLAMPIG